MRNPREWVMHGSQSPMTHLRCYYFFNYTANRAPGKHGGEIWPSWGAFFLQRAK